MASKKPQNKGLLAGLIHNGSSIHSSQHIHMAFVSQSSNPWDVPVKQSVLVMQKIWDATSVNEYEIMTKTSVY